MKKLLLVAGLVLKRSDTMIFWTGICWACTKCGSAFDIRCPVCGANPSDGKTEHKKEICSCPICKDVRKGVRAVFDPNTGYPLGL